MSRRQDKADRYFQLHHYMLKTDAWRGLSAPARAVYIQIGTPSRSLQLSTNLALKVP
jgi:hypothetical protein